MKKMKKLLSAILAIAMLLSMIVLPVSAEETTVDAFSVGETKTISLEAGAQAHFDFAAPESGNYILFDVNENSFGYAIVNKATGEDMNWGWWVHMNFSLSGPAFKAVAGDTYDICIVNDSDSVMTYSVSLVAAEPITELVLDSTEMTGTVGGRHALSVWPATDYAFEDITWSSSDESVAYVGMGPTMGKNIEFAAPGTATITATTESGLTASCVVTVKEAEPPTEIQLDGSAELTVEAGTSKILSFTAPETGRYIFYRDSSNYLSPNNCESANGNGGVSGDEWMDPQGDGYGWAFDMVAGEEYHIYVENWYGYDQTGVLSCVKAENYTYLAFNSAVSGAPGTTQYANLDFAPRFASEALTWTIDDTAVAQLRGYNGTSASINVLAVGTANLSVTTASGLSATCEIIAKEMEAITGDSFDVSLSAGGSAMYSYTPAEDGNYVFCYVNQNHGIGFQLQNVDANEWVSSAEWKNLDQSLRGEAFSLTGGETYSVRVQNWWDTEPQDCTILIAKTVPYEEVMITGETSCFIDTTAYLRLTGTPEFGFETADWSISDPEVAELTWEGATAINVRGLKAGTTTITATTSSGKSVSVELTVKEMETLGTEPTQVVLPAGESVVYTFTPAESGNYIFYHPINENFGIDVQHPKYGYMNAGDWQSDDDTYGGRAVAELTAGEQYFIYLNSWQDVEQTVNIAAVKAVAFENLAFKNAPLGFLGESAYVSVAGGPAFAYEPIDWTSSDPTVASVQYTSGIGASFNCLSVGTTTITATTASGLSISYDMSVQEKAVLKVDETVMVTIPYDTYTKVLFTPEEDGTYIIHYPADNYFGVNSCRDDDWNWYRSSEWNSSDGSRRGASFTLLGGKTYTLEVYNWNVSPSADLELTVTKAVPYTALAFTQDNFTGYVSKFQSVPLYLDYAPEYGGEELIYGSSNPEVAEAAWISGDCLYLQAYSTGTATITIQTADGRLRDDCTVTIKEPIAMSNGQEKSYALDPMGYVLITFSPTADGDYSFYCADNDYFGFSVHDSNGEWIQTNDRWTGSALIADIKATAGETYYIPFHSGKEVADTFKLGIGQATKATGMSVDVGSGKVYVGDKLYVLPEFAPVLAVTEEVTWKSSNENVVKFVEVMDDYGQVYYVHEAVSTGTVTLTGTSENGLTTTCKITVIEPEKIGLGTHSVTVPKYEYVKYEFTATEAGTYVIYDEDPDSRVGWIIGVGDDPADVKSYKDGDKVGSMITLAAGETAYPAVQSNTDEEKTFTFTFEQGAHEHVLTLVPAKEPNYIEPGNIEHYACACGKLYADAEGNTELTEEDVVVPALTPAASGECGDNLTWIMDDEGTVIISGTGPMWDYEDAMMEGATNLNPWIELNTKKVIVSEGATTIGNSAFSGCTSLTEVILPEGITSIGDAAFSFTAIAAIDLPDTLTTLGGSVFNETELVSLVIPEGVTSVGSYLFTHTPTLTEVILPSTLTTIPSYMFYGCSVNHVDIPEGVTAIGESAFENCGIESVTLPSTLVEIGVGAFRSSALKSITIPGSVKVVPAAFFGSKLEEVVICEGAEEIVAWAFGTCSSLNKVTIPASVKIIGYRAFQHNADGAEYYFMGDAPECIIADNIIGDATNHIFDSVTGTAYYPVDNATWTEEVMASFASENADITWVSYGSHALELVPAKEATYGEPGNIEHYGCTKCDKVFADAEGATELTVEDVTIPQLIQVEDGKAEIDKEAIDNAVAEVEQGGEVSIPVADAAVDVEIKSTDLPVESLTQITEKEATLTVEMPAATVTMDTAALAAVVEKAGENANVTLEVAEVPKEDLTETQVAAIQELDKNLVTTISAELLVNGENIATEADDGFGGGKVTVKIPVKISSDDFAVVYIADDGSTTVIENATYENGVLTMELEHFSTYAIVQDTMLGDVDGNGRIQTNDAKLILQYIVKIVNDLDESVADVDGNGRIQTNDAKLILQYIVKIITEFPAAK